MDNNYPTLKRPKKRLIYPTTKPRVADQWAQDIVSLEDVDKMFDVLGEDFPSPSPEIHIPKHKKRVVEPTFPPQEPLECQMVANGDHTPRSPELDIDSETTFKANGPVKTSSPIEGNAIQHKNELNKIEDNSASPILFDCEEENQDLEKAEKLAEKPQHNNHRKDESDDSIFETLPKKSVFDQKSAQKKNMASVRVEVPPEKKTESVQVPARVKHDMTLFLQKLRGAGQPKPARVGLLQPKVIPEPEPEDDFLILEDDAPLYVSIPSKTAISLKKKQSKTSSFDKETKDTPVEHSTEGQGTELDHRNQESQTLTKKIKKKTKGKFSESTSAASDKDQTIPATVESNNADNPCRQDVVITKKKKKETKNAPLEDDHKPDCEGQGTDSADGKPPKKTERKGEKTVEKQGSKPVKNNNGHSQKKRTPAKKNRKEENKANAVADGPEEQSQEVNCEKEPGNDSPVSEGKHLEAKSTGDLEDVNLKPQIHEDGRVLGKRKKKPTGQWWMSCPLSPPNQTTEKQQTVKKAKLANKDSSAPLASPVKATRGTRKKNLKTSSSSSSDCQRQKAGKNKVKKGNQKRARPVIRTQSEDSDQVFCELSQNRALNQDPDSSCSEFPNREHSISSGEKIFPKVYQNSARDKLSSTPDHASPTRPDEPLTSTETTKRRRKSPGNWWQVNPIAEVQEAFPLQPKQQKRKAAGGKREQSKRPTVRSPSKPLDGAKKRSLTTYSDLCSTVTVSPLVSKKTETNLKKQNDVMPPSAEDTEATHNVVSIETEECQRAQDLSPTQDTILESKVIRSGPSSMIGLENYEENDEDIVLPSTTVQPALCASDMCGLPLRPFILQPKDKANLQDWLKSLWPTTDRGPEITPDDFEWYTYQGRALGLMQDLLSGSLCNGKMLLGSFMKKPLWVDHSATTVFNLLTSSVNLIVDCNKLFYSAGQSFMVPPGHAYSIHNLSAQPAVFYFTRIYAEESDE